MRRISLCQVSSNSRFLDFFIYLFLLFRDGKAVGEQPLPQLCLPSHGKLKKKKGSESRRGGRVGYVWNGATVKGVKERRRRRILSFGKHFVLLWNSSVLLLQPVLPWGEHSRGLNSGVFSFTSKKQNRRKKNQFHFQISHPVTSSRFRFHLTFSCPVSWPGFDPDTGVCEKHAECV